MSSIGNTSMKCRYCASPINHVFLDLGSSPLANSYLSASELHCLEPHYSLCVYVCESCFLVQIEAFEKPENIFGDYAYFSSYSDSWLSHAKAYVEQMITRFGFDVSHHIVEIGSNDGYLLQYFVEQGIPVLGIEPALNVARVAEERGIPTITEFFGGDLAIKLHAEGKDADLLIGNNVLAHVPDLNDFVSSLKILLKPKGVITLEFPHLLRLMKEKQYDTIYHEHFSYFSFMVARDVFQNHGLTVFDVDELPTHGGSLRIYACHEEDTSRSIEEGVHALLAREEKEGFSRLDSYLSFQEKIQEAKRKLLDFLIHAKEQRKTLVGYGAPAKGNTLLNYCGIRTDFIEYTVDRSPHKQGKLLPGTHIPIFNPDKIRQTKPDYVLILPWNLKDEIIDQMSYIRDWGGQFIIPIPEVQVIE